MTSLLPDHFLRLMSASDRQAIKQRTAEETAMRTEAKTEKILQEQICCLLRRSEIPYIRPSMMKCSQLPVGWPDFTFAYRGYPIAWECKIGNKMPTEEQIVMGDKLERNGWRTAIIRTLLDAQGFLYRIELLANKKTYEEPA